MSDERRQGKRVLFVAVEVVLCLMIAIVLVGVVQQFFLAPVAVTGESMMPTINPEGDKVFVQKKFFKIEYRDVVVFYRPNSDEVTIFSIGGKTGLKSSLFPIPIKSRHVITHRHSSSTIS